MAFLCLLASFSLSEDDTDDHQKDVFVWGKDDFDVPYIYSECPAERVHPSILC